MHPTFELIQARAHQLWEKRGRPHGSANVDWLEAERELTRDEQSAQQDEVSPQLKMVEESLQGSFPASDPGATRIPDAPPSNADAKWRARGTSRSSAPDKRPPGGPR